jgi:pyrroloquinoline-quinone synthase
MNQFDKIVEEKHLLKHPFYQLWLDGKLPKEALQKYAGQYFQLVTNLPRFISKLHTNCNDEGTRQQLVRNLMEEELGQGNGDIAHTELWIDFAEELGVARKDVTEAEILEATKNVVTVIGKACEKSIAEGSAALYAYESQVPEISEEKIKGLQEFYSVNSEKALRFFQVHAEADRKHRAVWEMLSKKHTVNEELAEKANLAAKETTEALWQMFDAMYDEFVPMEIKTSC